MRPFPQYLGIGEFYEKDGHTTYESLQLKAEKRYSAGLSLLAAFTWEKNLVNADYPLSGGNSLFGLGAPQDNANYRSLKAYSPNDVPRRLVVSYIYELPFGKGKRFSIHHAPDWLLGGWQVSGIYSYQNATPLAFTTSLSNPLFGGPIRPNVGVGAPFRAPVSGASFNPFADNYINPRFHDACRRVHDGDRGVQLQLPRLRFLQRGHDVVEDANIMRALPRRVAVGSIQHAQPRGLGKPARQNVSCVELRQDRRPSATRRA